MPKVLTYTPEWLSRPNPGFQLFNTPGPRQALAQPGRRGSTQHENLNNGGVEYVGPNKIIARRGTEIFVVVAGKFIRWSDLSTLKTQYEELQATLSKNPRGNRYQIETDDETKGPEDLSYRVLQVNLGQQIRQLSVSPNGNLLAIATSHTVHIAILPDSSQLGLAPNNDIKLKTYTVGPTTHVLSQSQIANTLWHPCGVAGNSLVTVTADAVVRLWEFSRNNRWSSDSPSLAIDLKKLVIGSSEEENFSPNKFGRNRAFSSDAAGLEVASACFGGTGSSDESAWSALTLWFAMKGGDVYALCPLLPSKWQPSSTLVSSIWTATVASIVSTQKLDSGDSEERRQLYDQYEWICDIDMQDPMVVKGNHDFDKNIKIYSRPSNRSPVSRLQGPFQVFPEDADEDIELSDIHVIAGKYPTDETRGGDDLNSEADLADEHDLSAAMICLMTRSGRLYVCLDLEGVEGQWLPRTKPDRSLLIPKDPYLVLLEGIDTKTSDTLSELEWPTFTPDVESRYGLFVTHTKGIFFFSLDPWVPSLEKELQSNDSLGATFRMDIIKNGPGALRERILTFKDINDLVSESSVAACLVLQDSDLGYLTLTSVDGEPRAAVLDRPHVEPAAPFAEEQEEIYIPDLHMLSLDVPREVYRTPTAFSDPSSLPRFFEQHVPARHRRLMKQQVRMSTATLDLMTQAHRVLSEETHQLGVAAADLFRRCERLQEELRDQISRANEVAHRTEQIVGEDTDEYLGGKAGTIQARLDERMKNVRSRHQDLVARHVALGRKFSKVGGTGLSEKERRWFSEIEKARETIGVPPLENEQGEENEEEEIIESEAWQRFQDAKDLANDLVARAREAADQERTGRPNEDGMDMIPSDLRKEGVTKVMKLLERESALVEATQSRLNRLSLSSVS